LSASRNGLATLGVFFALFIISRAHRFMGLLIAIIAAFAGSTLYITIIEIIEVAGYEEFFRLQTLDFGSGRLYAWQAAWQEINKNFFWTGEGFAFAEESDWIEKYYLEIPDLIMHEGNIHNSFLTLWMNTGLIGLVLFMFPLLIIFGKAYAKTYYAVPVFFATMFLAFFESWLVASLNPYTIQFWMILTLMLTYNTPEVQEAYRKEVEHIKSTGKR
jgi:O-antigen ligase